MTYDQKIFSEFGLNIKIAGEIEFYVTPPLASEYAENYFQEQLLIALNAENIAIWNMQNEVAPNQYEVALQPRQPEVAIKEIKRLKEIISKVLLEFESEAIFKAKPFPELPGCGLHIHIGVEDEQGNSVMQRAGKLGEREGETEITMNIVGGLCSTMLKNFIHFAPNEYSYLRFSAKRNDIKNVNNPLATYNNVAVNVSWGGNNRTTAIRIPASSYDETNRHIEHRVAGADADPEAVINAILEGVYFGLKNKPTPPEKIYGNAFDKQYSFLIPFPKTLQEAKNAV